MRDRKTAILLAITAASVLGVAVFLFRGRLIESWWIWRLDSKDSAARGAAIQALGEMGSDRAAATLIARLDAPDGLGDSAVHALGQIHPRTSPKRKAEIIRCLLRALAVAEEADEYPIRRRGRDESKDALKGRTEPLLDRDTVRALCELPLKESEEVEALLPGSYGTFPEGPAAVCALLFHWADTRAAVASRLSSFRTGETTAFFAELETLTGGGALPSWWMRKPGVWPGTTVQKVGRDLARECKGPEARAIALSRSIFGTGLDGEPYTETEELKELARDDGSPLVRASAIRIAGFIGPVKGNLDLSQLLFEEKDPAILKEVVDARCLQAFPTPVSSPSSFAVAKYSSLGLRFELFDGLLCDWLNRDLSALPWTDREIERLREILDKESHTGLRDAASHALAFHHALTKPSPVSPHLPASLPRLSVHEWGVFRDEGEVSAPAEKWLADVPPFVRRCEVSTAELWSARYYHESISLKPVIYFRSPEPAILLVRVGFYRGRPWSFFPDATDYLDDAPNRTWVIPYEGNAKDITVQTQFEPGLTPPWLAANAGTEEPRKSSSDFHLLDTPPAGELRERFTLVPWITPNHSTHSVGSYALSSFGVEWCGLRVAFPPELERAAPAVDATSWWNHLREVPASTVALRGGSERFLFYDGAVRLPSPLEVMWTGESKEAISLTVRDLKTYPLPSGVGARHGVHPPTEEMPCALVVLKRPGAEPRGLFIERPSSRTPLPVVALSSLPLDATELRGRFRSSLEKEGLTPEESLALLRTWEHEFFEADGLRILTVLPQWIYDGALPLSIQPTPGEVVRVGVSWKECEESEKSDGPVQSAEPLRVVTAHYAWAAKKWPIGSVPQTFVPRASITIDAPTGELKGIPGTPQGAVLTADGEGVLMECWNSEQGESLVLADLEAGSCLPLFPLPGAECSISRYSASHDGWRIACVADCGRARCLRVIDVGLGTRLEVLTTLASADTLDWPTLSGDGTKVAFLRNTEIVWVDLEAQQSRRLRPLDGSTAEFLKLSRDGNLLYFISVAGGPDKRRELRMAEYSWGTVTSLGPWEGGLSYPSFSADGSRVLISRANGWGGTVACVLDRATGVLTRAAEQTASQRNLPALSADGKKVFHLRGDELWSVDVETGLEHRCLALPWLEACSTTVDGAGTVALTDSPSPSIHRLE